MSDARAEILGRIRAALADVPGEERPEDVPVERGYRTRDERPAAEQVAAFCETVADYGARVHRAAAGDVAQTVAAICREGGIARLAVPPELPAEWRPDGVEVVEDDGIRVADLDVVDGTLTGCAAAIAQTGTLVLDGGARSGRRALTLVPDRHVCVVEAVQVAGLVPEGLARVAGAVEGHGAPVTLISGPSASSDIELSRVEGVHGPRHLDVIVIE